MPTKNPFAWDKELDFNETLELLSKKYKEFKNYYFERKHYYEKRKMKDPKRLKLNIYYTGVLIVQLWNGLRVSEALESLNHFLTTGEREFSIKARKGGNIRKVIIPDIISNKDRKLLSDVIKTDIPGTVSVIKHFCKRVFGFNTHALRYSWISMMSEKGIPAQLIAKITGHKKLDFILHYTQKKEAEELFRETMKEISSLLKKRKEK